MILPVPETDRDKILCAALEKFRIDGFFKTTMDDIATQSGLSKNTIYKYFRSKENLTDEVVESMVEYVNSSIQKILKTRKNAIVKILEMLEFLVTCVLRFHNNMFVDIKIHMPEVWIKIENLRTKYMHINISKIIKQGKKEKLFLNYPNELIITLFMSSLRGVINPDFILNGSFTLDYAVQTTFNILLSGITTQKGKNIFNKLKNKKKYE